MHELDIQALDDIVATIKSKRMGTKLVRDKIPELIMAENRQPKIHIADREEFLFRLKVKLVEECCEFIESENPEELADVLEVVNTLKKFLEISDENLEIIRKNKFLTRGGFSKKIILDE